MLRWGFLVPWLRVLDRQYFHGIDRRHHSPFEPTQPYVRITLPDTQDETQTFLEGLKLLAVVAHVDYNEWIKVLFGHIGMTLGGHWEEDTDNEAIVRFQLKIGKDGGTVDDLVKMCGIQQHDHPRREYTEAMARIAAMDANRDATGRGVDIPVPVVAFFTEDVSPNELLRLRDAQRTCKWGSSSLPPVQPGGLRCSFVLAEVNAELKDYVADPIVKRILGNVGNSLGVATKMQQLMNENVWFSQISLKLDSDKVTRLKKEISGRLLASVFGSTCRSNESQVQSWEADNDTAITRQQVDHLSIDPVGQTRDDMEAICSAAIHSQTVRTLELFYKANSEDSVHWWQWIAYAFFSKRARTLSSLEGLSLKNIERMTTAEMEAFCGILTSENPEEELLGCTCAHTGLQEATLAVNSPIRRDFHQFGKRGLHSGVVKFPGPIPFLWIMSTCEQTEWVDALVPCYGRCQVLRRNLIFNHPVNGTRSGNALTALEIHFGYSITRDLRGLPHFFDAIGSTLKKLTIDAGDEDVDMEMVLEKCPKLEKLCFTKHLNTAIFNFSDYLAAGSPVPVFPFRLDDTSAFTEELMNPDSDLTKCLQRLTIYSSYDPYIHRGDVYQRELGGLLKMLKNNGRLEYLRIKLVRPGSYAQGFRKFHLQPIEVKIATSSKIAFLSVLSVPQRKKRQCQTGDKRRNWETFDANVVTNILQFAAAPLLRKVYVEYGR
ncbi:hypothetical protein DVH05_010098 [Phytophthora capsici]|nr:hypothetical protein DVH05_010098 [Phytophthora capsici]